jgi:hypothetical protein
MRSPDNVTWHIGVHDMYELLYSGACRYGPLLQTHRQGHDSGSKALLDATGEKIRGAPVLIHLLLCSLLVWSRTQKMSADQEFLLPTEPKEEVLIQPWEPLWFKKSALLHIALVIVYTIGSVLAIRWTKAHDQPRPHDANCKLSPLTVHP